MISKSFFSYLLLFLFLLSACSTDQNKNIEKKKVIELEILYKEAFNNFEKGDYETAVKLFELVEKDYSYTSWASQSLLMRSFIYYDTSNYIRALENLQRFKKKYAGNKNMDYAEYLIGLCLFEQINFSYLSQQTTELALKQFNLIIKEYPDSKYVSDVKFKIDLLREQLASKEIYIARYYAKRKKWLPAMYRLNNILKNYQDTIFIEEALHRLVEINYSIGNVESAKKYASILGYNYNNSEWYKKSYKIIEPTKEIPSKEKNKISLKEKFKELIKIK